MIKNYILSLILSVGLYTNCSSQTVNIPIFDNVLFYDGYATLVNFPTAPDVVRLKNNLFTKKLTSSILSQVGTTLTLNVFISAACDNYDRIGNINLALVPKGATSYDPATTSRIELGRYITPFMDKNVPPNLVPFVFTIDNVAKILKDSELNLLYDFWIELDLFGVPYAANTQIAGCAGRADVFYGTLNFVTNSDTTLFNNTFLLPLNFQNNLNNYTSGASDAIGTTARTINYNLPNALNNAKMYLITSNHGSNSGGEEYIRRWHYVYLDGSSTSSLTYKPGELTCEPYRIFNTQGNGIYSPAPRTPSQWQSFSNWCPGAVIPIRKIDIGSLSAGSHSFRIAVPAATFAGMQGNFPVSLYLQGENTTLGTNKYEATSYEVYPIPSKDFININCSNAIETIQLLDIQGRILKTKSVNSFRTSLDISDQTRGVYFIKIFSGQESSIEKIIKN